MSGSDWGNTDKNRLIQACIIAFLFIALFSAWGYCVQSGYYQQAANKSAQYQGWADDEIRQRCGSRPDIFREKCERKINQTAHENQRDEYDLYAQRTSALWAGIIAVAALFGIGLSGVGVWLVKTTFDETRLANTIAKQATFRQLRAYVTVESVERERNIRVGEWPEFDCVNITMHNSGATPANCVKIIYDRIEVIDGALVNKPTEIRLTAIGGQSRKVKPLAWVCFRSVLSAKLAIPRNISGELFYQAVIPDESGKFIEFVEPFNLEAYAPKITAIKLDDNGFIKTT